MDTLADFQEVILVFDGKGLLIRTDVREVADFVISSHKAMLADGPSTHDQVMEIVRAENGFTLEGHYLDGVASPEYLFDLIRLRIASAFVAMRPELLWIHSGVVGRDDRALLIVGASGQGKSTLVTFLNREGWSFLSDEMAPIDVENGSVHPYPRTPLTRIPVATDVDALEVSGMAKEAFSPHAKSIATAPLPIGAFVFPRFSRRGETAIQKLSAGEASIELIRSCTNFVVHKDEAVTGLAELASKLPAWRVTYGDGRDAANVLHSLRNEIFLKS